jgi:hypothetical protein
MTKEEHLNEQTQTSLEGSPGGIGTGKETRKTGTPGPAKSENPGNGPGAKTGPETQDGPGPETGPAKSNSRTRTRTRANKKEKEAVGIPVLNSPEPPAPTAPPIPKKKPKKKVNEKVVAENAANFALLIQGVFNIVAMRSGDHWAITQEEAQGIATPAARIMERYDITEKVNEYGDYVALAVATGMVIVPRVIISQMQKPTKAPAKVVTDANERPPVISIDKNAKRTDLTSPAGSVFKSSLDANILD